MVGRTPAEVCAAASDPFDEGAVGPLCVLRDSALAHNLKTMADWCREHGGGVSPATRP